MAFGRILNIFAGPEPGGVRVEDPELVGPGRMLQLVGFDRALGIEPLHAECDLHRSNRMDRNTGEVRVLNLKESVRRWLENSGNIIQVDIGYEDEGSGTVFLGQTHKISSTLIGGAWVTKIPCYQFRAKTMDFETLLVAVSYDPGTNLQTVITGLGQILGVTVFGEDVSGIELDGGFVAVGTMKQALDHVSRTLANHGYGIFYDLGEVFVYKACKPTANAQTIEMELGSGLISAKWVQHEKRDWRKDVQTAKTLERRKAEYAKTKSADGRTRVAQNLFFDEYRFKEARRARVELTGLASHLARPNCPIHVRHPAITGVNYATNSPAFFVADDINFKLSNFGNDFDMTIFASQDPTGKGEDEK
jgi:hypothetical protein